MKKILLLLLVIFVASCSKSDNTPDSPLFEEFITVNGDIRNLESLTSVKVERYEADILQQQLQLSLELEDQNRNTIGDLGGFNNDQIRLWVTIYSDDDLDANPTDFKTLHDDSIGGSVPVSADRINVFINLLTDEEEESIYGSAENNQTVTAYIEDEFLIVEWDKLKFVKSYEFSELEFTSSGRLKGRIIRNDR